MVDREDDGLKPGRKPKRTPKEKALLYDPNWVAKYDAKDPMLYQNFKNWHHANKQVYRTFLKQAREVFATGRDHYSGYTIFTAIRFMIDLKTTGGEFKINNGHIPMYIRSLMDKHPEFRGFFTLRPIGIDNMKRKPDRDDDFEPA